MSSFKRFTNSSRRLRLRRYRQRLQGAKPKSGKGNIGDWRKAGVRRRAAAAIPRNDHSQAYPAFTPGGRYPREDTTWLKY